MPDPVASPAVTPGAQTSEGKLAKLNVVIGGILAVVGAIYAIVGDLSGVLPNSKYIGGALTVCGIILKLAAQLGYSDDRTKLKIAEIEAGGPKTIEGSAAKLGAL